MKYIGRIFDAILLILFIATPVAMIIADTGSAKATPNKNPCAWFAERNKGGYQRGGSESYTVACTDSICVACTRKGDKNLDCRKFNPNSCFN